ncbi:hypothetical protein DICPUDRAFT_75525 [Dictyostelium purpureum]|uniref:B box-type domain-containing protein n=1 Tax=Dictyostelium purpureum TaxID=5786 RepID=F0ZAW9_DICPU|nr:uncharacterized protein DICPUDRAFT_75525 [Dictyostelium purpureum]EGC38901.1 hypothetical protein DICPUDRAFT_75525 [Dictyostelium purpureum]|eukprot:XP_003284581.1 hypothetical protein DICPUDRAFT_75525 [Dictyostelium purpureum]
MKLFLIFLKSTMDNKIDRDKITISHLCTDHDMEFSHVCTTCRDVPTCLECVTSTHQGHFLKKIEQITFKEKLENFKKNLKKVEDLIKDCEKNKQNLFNLYNQLSEIISKTHHFNLEKISHYIQDTLSNSEKENKDCEKIKKTLNQLNDFINNFDISNLEQKYQILNLDKILQNNNNIFNISINNINNNIFNKKKPPSEIVKSFTYIIETIQKIIELENLEPGDLPVTYTGKDGNQIPYYHHNLSDPEGVFNSKDCLAILVKPQPNGSTIISIPTKNKLKKLYLIFGIITVEINFPAPSESSIFQSLCYIGKIN